MKIRSLIAALLALVLIASACGSDEAGAAAGDGTWPDKITFGLSLIHI